MLLLLLGIIIGGGLLGLGIFWNINGRVTGHIDRGPVCIIFGIIILMGLGATLFVSQMISVYENGCLVVSKQNFEAYRKTAVEINELAVVQNVADGKMIGGLENMSQSTMASQALIEYRDMIKEYNNVIGYRKVVLSNIWISIFVQSLPEGIDVFEFKLKEE